MVNFPTLGLVPKKGENLAKISASCSPSCSNRLLGACWHSVVSVIEPKMARAKVNDFFIMVSSFIL